MARFHISRNEINRLPAAFRQPFQISGPAYPTVFPDSRRPAMRYHPEHISNEIYSNRPVAAISAQPLARAPGFVSGMGENNL
jgi:hypothetical protein